MLMAAGLGAIKSRKRSAHLAAGNVRACHRGWTLGFYYHARGVLRRPGGRKLLLYNIMYGPPIFAPLACLPPADL